MYYRKDRYDWVGRARKALIKHKLKNSMEYVDIHERINYRAGNLFTAEYMFGIFNRLTEIQGEIIDSREIVKDKPKENVLLLE